MWCLLAVIPRTIALAPTVSLPRYNDLAAVRVVPRHPTDIQWDLHLGSQGTDHVHLSLRPTRVSLHLNPVYSGSIRASTGTLFIHRSELLLLRIFGVYAPRVLPPRRIGALSKRHRGFRIGFTAVDFLHVTQRFDLERGVERVLRVLWLVRLGGRSALGNGTEFPRR